MIPRIACSRRWFRPRRAARPRQHALYHPRITYDPAMLLLVLMLLLARHAPPRACWSFRGNPKGTYAEAMPS